MHKTLYNICRVGAPLLPLPAATHVFLINLMHSFGMNPSIRDGEIWPQETTDTVLW